MTAPARQRRAVLAAAVAAFGLAAAPVLHAELHVRERALARRAAIDRLFRLAFQRERGPGHAEAIARAVEEAFGAAPAHPHQHGPAGGDRPSHEAGALAHLALAAHVAPVPPPLPRPLRAPEPDTRKAISSHPVPRYLVPERSQAPPRA